MIKDGQVAGSRGVCTDISALKEAQSALRENEAMLQSILRAAPVGIGFGIGRTIQWSNDYYQRMTGYEDVNGKGRPARILYDSEEEYLRVGEALYSDLGKENTGETVTRWTRRDGSVVDVLLCVSPLFPVDAAQGVVISALDVTEKKKAEEALRASEARYRELADHLPVGIYEAGFDGKVTYANSTALKMYGYGADEVAGGGLSCRSLPPRITRWHRNIRSIREGRRGLSRSTRCYEGTGAVSEVDQVTADDAKRPDRRLLGHRHGHQRAQTGPGGPAEERGPAGKHSEGGPHRCGDRP